MDAHSYMPVLRWKRSEQLALSDLYPGDANLILPLVEVVPNMLVENKLDQLPKQITKAWGGRRLLVDGAPPAAASGEQSEIVYRLLASNASSVDAGVVPVIRPSGTLGARRAAIDVAAAFGAGVAFRVTPDKLDSLAQLLSESGIGPEDNDLVVDFGCVGANDGRYKSAHSNVPRLNDWRTIVFVGGSFPRDLTGLDVGQHLLPREEWNLWTDLSKRSAGRIPLYGDYATQHANYAEPPRFANVSASIRYTARVDWVVMRGEGLQNAGGAGHAQYPANAQLLRERAEYCGPGFSAGDDYIELMGTNPPSTGNPASWLRAGLNHHMTLACRQAANLL